MRKLLLGLALCLVGGFAAAQNITKSLQQSQDPTGKYGIDSPAQNLYLPGHLLTIGSGVGGPTTPTVGVQGTCGTGAVVTGTDTAGTIVTGAGSTGCIMNFAQPYLTTPYCLATSGVTATSVFYTSTTSPIGASSISFTYTGSSGLTINYFCSGSK